MWVPISHKKKLETEIRDYLNSPDHKKGESGDKEYEGRNLPPSVIKILLPIDNKITAADNAVQAKEFSNALTLYQEALTAAETAQSQAILESHPETIQEELGKRIERIKDKLSTVESKVT
ncbi:MAG: hypothetical protein D3909_03665, partial [Candidatus Electrothrix sp. ATG1]|nr:hypothetical protein [Candidatus Electrothrix sp. ATG1]